MPIALLTSVHQNYSTYRVGRPAVVHFSLATYANRAYFTRSPAPANTVQQGERKMTRTVISLLLALATMSLSQAETESQESGTTAAHHHRQKRVFWITNDGRISLPPGTVMTITPTLALPLVRYPPHGFLSNMTISLPFTIDFDKLGLTDNENPYGGLPPIFGRGMKSREAGMILADFVASFIKRRIKKRNTDEPPPKNAFHGGERALLYGTAEDMLSTLGLDGKACLLRAICEVQGHPLHNFGLIGEMLKLFFTASKSPFANILKEYVDAENRGKIHGECWPYFKDCPKSLFVPSTNKYSKDSIHNDSEPDWEQDSNEISESYGEEPQDITQKHTINPAM